MTGSRIPTDPQRWLRAQPTQPTTIADLQHLLDDFAAEYNQHRPHRSLNRPGVSGHVRWRFTLLHRATPATIYQTLPKAAPNRDRSTDTHDRVRHDKIDKAGTLRVAGHLRHSGIGRTYARTDVILLVQDPHVTIIDVATGQLPPRP